MVKNIHHFIITLTIVIILSFIRAIGNHKSPADTPKHKKSARKDKQKENKNLDALYFMTFARKHSVARSSSKSKQ